MRVYANKYLASGGPTSRLEESLRQLGQNCELITEVFATPTGVFVSAGGRFQDPATVIARIPESGINLGQLVKLEQLLDDVNTEKVSVRVATETLDSALFSRSFYRPWQTAAAAFGGGFVVSFASYQSMIAALGCGAIALLTWLVSGSFLARPFPNLIFRHFLGAVLSIGLAAIANAFYPLSMEAYSMGGLIILVPGLAITTAIAELAEQNLVSGTAKLMQAGLVVVSLGLAYLLVQEVLHSFAYVSAAAVSFKTADPYLAGAAILASVACFGVIFKVPPKSLPLAALTGACGWFVFHQLVDSPFAITSTFAAAFMVGVLSLGLGRFFALPSQVYSVPGIIALLPGMLAFSSFRYFAAGNNESAGALGFKVILAAVSITFGLMAARFPFRR